MPEQTQLTRGGSLQAGISPAEAAVQSKAIVLSSCRPEIASALLPWRKAPARGISVDCLTIFENRGASNVGVASKDHMAFRNKGVEAGGN